MRNYVSKNSTNDSPTYVGTHGEITVDPNTLAVRVHDGVTPGGMPIGSDLGNLVVDGQTLHATTSADMVLGGTDGFPRITLESGANGGNVVVSTTGDAWLAEYGRLPVNNTNDLFGSSLGIDSMDNIYTIGDDQSGPNSTLLKYDSYGNLLWQKTIDIPGSVGESIEIDASDAPWAMFSNYDDSTVSIAKLDGSGNVVTGWSITSTGVTNHGFDLALDGTQNVVIVGHTYSIGTTFPNITSAGASGYLGQLWVLLGTFGAEIPTGDGTWTMVGTGITGVANITDVMTGSVYHVTIDQPVDFDAPGGTWTISHSRALDLEVAKLNTADGTMAWQYAIGNSFGDDSYGVVIDSNDNAMVTGYIADPTTLRYTMGLVKIDSDGNLIFKKTVTAPNAYLKGQDITLDDSGNVYVTGVLQPVGGLNEIFLARLDSSNGNVVWARTLGASGIPEKGISIAFNGDDGNLYLSGMWSGIDAGIIVASINTAGDLLWQRKLARNDTTAYQWRTNGQKAMRVRGNYLALTGYYMGDDANQFTARLSTNGTGMGRIGAWTYSQGFMAFSPITGLVTANLATNPVQLSMASEVASNSTSDIDHATAINTLIDPDKGIVTQNVIADLVQTYQIYGRADLSVHANGNLSIESTNDIWQFGPNGLMSFPDGTTQTTAWAGGRVVAEPTSSKGSVGDLSGDISFGSEFIYRCTADYTDGNGDIWSRVALDATPWP